ncbi:StAR- lipid transfer protein 7, mitochondrial [Branchiostoma belcheri]|nr:StAR- lipid transfer protein 7, mitochondrial [Branchiostoma belcheri]
MAGYSPFLHTRRVPIVNYIRENNRLLAQGFRRELVTKSGCREQSPSWRSVAYKFFFPSLHDSVVSIGRFLAQQFNVYAAQRIRRMGQVWSLYRDIYNDKTVNFMVSRFGRRLAKSERTRRWYVMFGAVCFAWDKERITDQELDCYIQDMWDVQRMKNNANNRNSSHQTNTEVDNRNSTEVDSRNSNISCSSFLNSWERVIDRTDLKVWRKPMEGSSLYQYKVYGTFHDISARTFFNVQLDLNYRKEWDKLVLKLEVIDKDDDDGSEVVHWVMHYPYPMYSREYVYLRRHKVDTEANIIVLASRSVEHPACPESNQYVRVATYSSNMVIKPHRTFDEDGFDYILTYNDDPKAFFPSYCINWMASSGLPDFISQLHQAAYNASHKGSRGCLGNLASHPDAGRAMAN